jgi:hypothetical protein
VSVLFSGAPGPGFPSLGMSHKVFILPSSLGGG